MHAVLNQGIELVNKARALNKDIEIVRVASSAEPIPCLNALASTGAEFYNGRTGTVTALATAGSVSKAKVNFPAVLGADEQPLKSLAIIIKIEGDDVEKVLYAWSDQNSAVILKESVSYVINIPATLNDVAEAFGDISDNPDIPELAATIDFDSDTKYIQLKNLDGDVISSFDASTFIVDGMVDSVEIVDDALVISWNTASGKEDVSIPLSSFFDASDYYTKSETDSAISDALEGALDGYATDEELQTVAESIPTVNNSTITIKKNADDAGNSFTTNAASDTSINLGLATVATSGSYADLSNTPSIPTVNNAVLTIKKNAEDSGSTFSANASSDVSVNLGLNDAAFKGVDTSIVAASDGNLPTSGAVKAYVSSQGVVVNNSTITIKKNSEDTLNPFSFTTNQASNSECNLGLADGAFKAVDTSIGSSASSNIPTTDAVKDYVASQIPVVPTVNNATLTIKKNASDTGTAFTANASVDVTCSLGLADVATSGSYQDLSNKPSIPTVNDAKLVIKKNQSDTGTEFTANASSDVTCNLGLADVATSGSYTDLSNKPTIPTVNNSTITIKKNASDTGDSFTTNAASDKSINLGLATVATSGDYTDLSNTPSIPTVNDAKLTIKKNADDSGTEFTANASSDVTCNLGLADVATSGSYNDLSNTPTIGTATITIKKNASDTTNPFSFSVNATSNAEMNIGLADVATSGSYNDLSNKPTIPTVNNATLTIKKNASDTGSTFTANASSDVTCNLGLADVATSGSYSDLSNTPTIPTVNNGTLTIKKNSSDTGSTFTANSSSDVTCNLGLADVATSGSYNDLSNTPTIPTVNNATLTIKKNTSDSGTTFTANASSDVSCNLGLDSMAFESTSSYYTKAEIDANYIASASFNSSTNVLTLSSEDGTKNITLDLS